MRWKDGMDFPSFLIPLLPSRKDSKRVGVALDCQSSGYRKDVELGDLILQWSELWTGTWNRRRGWNRDLVLVLER